MPQGRNYAAPEWRRPSKPKATVRENNGKYCKRPPLKEILPPLEQRSSCCTAMPIGGQVNAKR